MASGEFAEPIYKLIEELGDTDEARSTVLNNLISWLRGKTIEDFVESFRTDWDMPESDETTQPPQGASKFFSSQIPEC